MEPKSPRFYIRITAAGLDLLLEQREGPPCHFSAVSDAVRVHRPALEEVPNEGVGLVGRLRPVPMQRRARMVLFPALLAALRYGAQGIREVVENAGSEGDGLAGLGIGGEPHRRLNSRRQR